MPLLCALTHLKLPVLFLLLLRLPLQGLNKIDMVTMVVGSHSIGGYRTLSNPDLTACPFVPFDCTTSGQTSSNAPFDNNVFKVGLSSHCNGQSSLSLSQSGLLDRLSAVLSAARLH